MKKDNGKPVGVRVETTRQVLRAKGTLTIHGVSKSDVGEWDNDSTMAMKAVSSDSFKRSAVLWSLFRYAYDLEQKWCKYDNKTKKIVEPPILPDWALPVFPCVDCKKPITRVGQSSPYDIKIRTTNALGRPLCADCGKIAAAELESKKG